MREISSEKVKIGEHVIIDGVEYMAEEVKEKDCRACALRDSVKCTVTPCTGVVFKKVEKEPRYRPYKDTEEMIADYKERFMVGKIPDFCMPLIWLTHKADMNPFRVLITSYEKQFVCFFDVVRPMEELFNYYTYLDGSPCGKLEG